MEILQNTDAPSFYWMHQAVTCLAWALAFFLVGLIFAAIFWRRNRRKALQLAEENKRLQNECIDLGEEIEEA